MTMTLNEKRHQLIRLIHVAKRELKLTDDAYRAALAGAANGKESSADMNLKELESVMTSLKNAGFKHQLKRKQKRLSPAADTRVKADEISKIRAVWITMFKQRLLRDGSESALNSYVKRMTVQLNNGVGVDEVAWLNCYLAVKVLESLKNWHRRLMIDAIKAAGRSIPFDPIKRRAGGYEQICAAYDAMLDELSRTH